MQHADKAGHDNSKGDYWLILSLTPLLFWGGLNLMVDSVPKSDVADTKL